MSADCNIPTRGRSTTKKALLIGIGYRFELEQLGQIRTSIPNVKKFETFLRESYEYEDEDIVVMTDEDGVEERYRPTHTNLERETRALCRGVEPGDRRVFYFAGHSVQTPCRTGSEEDGMDEALVAANGSRIRDNTLNDLLVKGLPKGSALTAIFDCCTSGTLLDLEHHKCNTVWRPWVNKGERMSNTLRNGVVRRDGGDTRSLPPSRRLSTYRRGSGELNVHFSSLLQLMSETGDTCPTSVLASFVEDPDRHLGQRATSPERQFKCEGWCRDEIPSEASLEHPDVVSISSSNDGQFSWDASTRSGDSISMTTHLITILKQHPQITYSELMIRLNHSMHSFTSKMHDYVKRESRARRRADGMATDSEDTTSEEEPKGEMNNFQDLQLGSITPVDMDRLFML